MIALHRADFTHSHISRVISVVGDALIRRMIDLAIESEGQPPAEFAWLSLGSHGRREPMPSSDVDSGMAWRDTPGPDPTSYMHAIAVDVEDCLEAVGWRCDPHGVVAADRFPSSSIGEWQAAIERWLAHPADNKVLIATSILLDGRTVYGPQELHPKTHLFESQHRSTLLRWLLRLALSAKPPTGFMHDIVVEHSGEHRGTLDIKHGGLLPILDLARYAALKADARVTPTIERLRAAGEAGVLDQAHARTLTEAFDLKKYGGVRNTSHFQGLVVTETQCTNLCPLWVISRHSHRNKRCLLYPGKRTCAVREPKSAKGQKRTFAKQKVMSALHLKPDIRQMVAGTTPVFEIAYRAKIIAMPKDGATIFGDLIGKLEVLRVSCSACGRDGRDIRASHSVSTVVMPSTSIGSIN